MTDHWEQRVRYYEAQGMTRSDAQGIVDAEDLRADRAYRDAITGTDEKARDRLIAGLRKSQS